MEQTDPVAQLAEELAELPPTLVLSAASDGPDQREEEHAVQELRDILRCNLRLIHPELIHEAPHEIHQADREADVRRRGLI